MSAFLGIDAIRPTAPSQRRREWGWALFEFARAPTFTLVFMFVFAPYFAQTVAGDPVRGQELWGLANTITGASVGLLAPLIGAAADRMGNRKPWIVLAVLIVAAAEASLWFALPGAEGGLSLPVIVLMIALAGVMFGVAALMHNAMLAAVAPPSRVGHLSGLGLGLGNVASFTAIVGVLVLIALPATRQLDFAFIPASPAFGLDAAAHEHARIAGPLGALWLLLFVIPFLLLTPDSPATGVRLLRAFREGADQLVLTVRRARQVANVGRFLLARMLYNDAIIAMQAYCAIYAAGVFGWDAAAILIFAVLITGFCFLGGLIAAWVDGRLGSRRAIIWFNLAMAVALVASVSMGPGQIFFLPYEDKGPIWSFPYFATLPEFLFLVIFLSLGIFATVVLASSRAMLARIAPLGMMTQFFGLYALSGVATAFIGHGLVTLATSTFDSQRVGFVSVLLILALGLALMLGVREERAPSLDQALSR